MALFNKTTNETTQTASPRPTPASVPNPMQLNMVGPGATFEGVLRTKSDTIINGKVIGKIFVEGRLVINPEGFVEGEVNATNADIAGKITGDVNCDERLSLKSGGRVDGNISTKKLSVEDGASFTGKCSMTIMEAPTSEAPAFPASTDPKPGASKERFAAAPGVGMNKVR
ncbi:MAG: polymer-forming cytoskeletal protein [Bacteroidetes Order II. Incertae sedis bacterium]|nr:polymer-forming cytoskeletal protein [Bacteroidetes Order II. bacterium]